MPRFHNHITPLRQALAGEGFHRVFIAAQEPVSYSERYGGPRYPTASQVAQRSEPTMARGRLFLIVGTVVTLLLIVVVSGSVQAF